MRSRQLDLALARGAAPEATAPLALRARRLTSLWHRRAIAASYRRLVSEAREAGPKTPGRMIPPRSQVGAASDELSRLADELARPGPVAAQGVAEALLLLSDGTGPLHNPRSNAILRACVASAAENLALRPR